jgi:glycosyltransferase involved in cell wall biosynthesis
MFEIVEKEQFVETNKRKKILSLTRFACPELGGGEVFLATVLNYLSSHGYDCSAACFADPKTEKPFSVEKQLEWRGVKTTQLVVRRDEDLYNFLKKEMPDIVITQSFSAPIIVDYAKSLGIKTIFIVLFWRNLVSVKDNFTNMLTRPMDSVKLLYDNHRVFNSCDKICVNSEFMQQAVKRYIGLDIETIIHPVFKKENILSKNKDPRYIVLINSDCGKGGRIFCEIAKRMPDKEFLCVGLGNEFIQENIVINKILRSLKNVEIIEKTYDMASVYGKTKILLVPSLVDETFSICSLEAMSNGLPVLVSPQGNLPFLVENENCVLPLDNIQLWIDKINFLLSDEKSYNKLSARAKQIADKYDPETDLNKFLQLVRECENNL